MVDFRAIESKWQKKWEEKKVYEPDVDKTKPKFFLTVPYPYVNGLLHLGSAYTFSRGDFLARFKRMKDYNVLWPQGWHITGAPIVGNALRLREEDPKIQRDLEIQRIPKEDWEKLKTPEGWALYFIEKNREAFKKFGFSIDWRREFYTTYLNKPYSKFIHWQYRKLKEKGLITKGKHPVVWDPKVQKVIGDHDRPDEYAGIQPQEVILIKFKDKEGIIYSCCTFRPETVYGVTNLWVNPEADYVLAEVDGEKWIFSKDVVEEIKDQEHEVKVLEEFKGKNLLGKIVINPITNEEVLILPASFVDPEIGTGIVMSVPAHAPYDYIALKDLEKNPEWSEIAKKCLASMKSLIKLEGFSEFPAKDICEKLGIKSQEDKELLEKATKEIYSKEFYNGTLREIFGKFSGKKVCEAKNELIKELISKSIALKHYILPVRFESRYGGKVHVKIVSDQWFIKYSDPKWKELAHKCIDQMRFLPEEVRNNFHYTVDWLKDWACVHQRELGTPWPWDEKWTIESLSDSTIYMAYYIIAKYLQHPEKYGINIDKIDDSFFDYIFLEEGNPDEISKKIGIKKELLEKIREEFEYWYPVDLRTSGKDLIQNHLTFFIFHHVAIFPEKYWPKGIAVNGWVLMDGRKMSKSLGNMIPMLHVVEKHPVDIIRFLLAYAGETGFDDANLEYSRTKEIKKELENWYNFCLEFYNKGRENKTKIDEWFLNVLNKKIKEAEELYENMMYKTLLVKCYYELQNLWKWYLKRTNNDPNRECVSKFIEYQTLILYPIIPHIASEILEKIEEEDFALNPMWPRAEEFDENLEKLEDIVKGLEEDLKNLINLLKSKGKEKIEEVKIIVASKDKFEMLKWIKENIDKDFREIMKEASQKGYDIKLVQKVLKDKKIVDLLTSQDEEYKYLIDSREYFENLFGCKFTIEFEKESLEDKKKFALPGKPAIVVL